MTLRRALSLAALLLVLPHARLAGAAEIKWRNFDAGLREAKSTGRPMMVDVYADWCRYCKIMDREVFSRDDVQRYLARRFVPVRLDGEGAQPATYEGRTYTGATLAQRFRVNGFPTFIFLRPDGAHLINVPGYVPAERFLALLRFVGDGALERGEDFEAFTRKAGAQAR
jgi:thioredoxin-related protein